MKCNNIHSKCEGPLLSVVVSHILLGGAIEVVPVTKIVVVIECGSRAVEGCVGIGNEGYVA